MSARNSKLKAMAAERRLNPSIAVLIAPAKDRAPVGEYTEAEREAERRRWAAEDEAEALEAEKLGLA